uniref:RHS repeat-associated core domain-containing protein n=1 Tax=Parastrongyloides trichosuri TaxID=131310 RepID=A0A0N4ZHB5_PARTI
MLKPSQQTILVRVCEKEGDNYRFGWNSHEKVNEIAGIGNHTTAEFGEFDTRLGRRWNPDPKSGLMPNESPYAVNHGNPITYKDPKGDFGFIGAAIGAVVGGVIEYGSQAVSNIIQGKSLKDALWNEIDFADVAVSVGEGALAGTTGGASLLITRVTAGAVRASVDYTNKDGLKYIGGIKQNEKKFDAVLLDAGSELVGGAAGKFFDKAGLNEFVRKPSRSLFNGGAKKAMQSLGDKITTGAVETAIPTIIDGAVRGEVIADEPIPTAYEDADSGKLIPYKTPQKREN